MVVKTGECCNIMGPNENEKIVWVDLSWGTSHGGHDVMVSVRARCGRAGGWQNIWPGTRHVCSEAAEDTHKSGAFVRVLAFLKLVCIVFQLRKSCTTGSRIRFFSHPQKGKFGGCVDVCNASEQAGNQSSDMVCSYSEIPHSRTSVVPQRAHPPYWQSTPISATKWCCLSIQFDFIQFLHPEHVFGKSGWTRFLPKWTFSK